MIYPIDQKVRLGLDLKGGVHLVLRVQTDEALRVESETSMERMRSELVKAGAAGVTATVVDPTTFELKGVPDAQSALVRQLGTEIEHTYNRESGAGGTLHASSMKPNIAVQLRDDTVMPGDLQTIERRVNELGVAEPDRRAAGRRAIRSWCSSRASPTSAAPRRSSARRRCSS